MNKQIQDQILIMKCFKCEKEMKSMSWDGTEIPSQDSPHKGVLFEGGWNFGSNIYDTLMDGIYVQLIICDDCLTAHRDKIRELSNDYQRRIN